MTQPPRPARSLAYLDGKRVRILEQVLFNVPAYKVNLVGTRDKFTIEGAFLADDEHTRFDLLGNQLAPSQ
jgi:hypothetical protein